MSRRRTRLRGLPDDLADELGPDDGEDPKAFHDRRPRGAWVSREPGRKVRQLCGRAADVLRSVLAGCADDVLRELTVVSVEPAPHAGRLMVTVAAPADVTDRAAVAAHLGRAGGLLRGEIAAAVSRRYAPELAFCIV